MKINSVKDIFTYIDCSNKDFSKNINNNGGFPLFFRALAAQTFWVVLVYKISLLLIPIKDFYASNALVLIIVAAWCMLSKIFKDNLPEWINEVISEPEGYTKVRKEEIHTEAGGIQESLSCLIPVGRSLNQLN